MLSLPFRFDDPARRRSGTRCQAVTRAPCRLRSCTHAGAKCFTMSTDCSSVRRADDGKNFTHLSHTSRIVISTCQVDPVVGGIMHIRVSPPCHPVPWSERSTLLCFKKQKYFPDEIVRVIVF